MGFVLFILVNAALFIRPGEIVPDLEDWSIYQWLILGCMVAAYPLVFKQFTREAILSRPVNVCVVGTWVAVVLSNLAHGDTIEARQNGWDFGKVILYYLLLVAVVDTPEQLRKLLLWLAGFIVILALIAVLQYHGVIEMASLTTLEERKFDEETGEFLVIPRLRSTGIFNDPNDLCLVLGVGIQIGLYFGGDKRRGPLRFAWLLPIALFGYTLVRTQSRGGLMGVAAGVGVLCYIRFGWWKTVAATVVAVPLLLAVIGGRQANFDVSDKENTGQARVQIWAEGFALFRQSPLFGIGANKYADAVGLVAHNSFVHGYVELGLLGGSLFVGAFYCALAGLSRAGAGNLDESDPEFVRLRPYLMAMVVGYGVGLLSLSRNYVCPTVLVLGLASDYAWLSAQESPVPVLRLDGSLARRLVVVSLGAVVLIYASIRILARWE
jgi:putative inorganic carbon (HCO3(-)) transporter